MCDQPDFLLCLDCVYLLCFCTKVLSWLRQVSAVDVVCVQLAVPRAETNPIRQTLISGPHARWTLTCMHDAYPKPLSWTHYGVITHIIGVVFQSCWVSPYVQAHHLMCDRCLWHHISFGTDVWKMHHASCVNIIVTHGEPWFLRTYHHLFNHYFTFN